MQQAASQIPVFTTAVNLVVSSNGASVLTTTMESDTTKNQILEPTWSANLVNQVGSMNPYLQTKLVREFGLWWYTFANPYRILSTTYFFW